MAAALSGVVEGRQSSPDIPVSSQDTLVFIGSHGDKGQGIHVFRLQSAGTEVFQNVTLVPLGLAAEAPNPTVFELDARRRVLFTVNEIEEFEGKPSGSVSAYAIDAIGRLQLLNRRPSGGTRPCHLVLDKDARHVLVANCGSGSIAVFPIAADGSLGPATDTEPAAGRQTRCVTLDPASRFALVCDAASDRVAVYSFDSERGQLTAKTAGSASLNAGAGPRQIVFRPDGRFAYVLNGNHSTITTFSYDEAGGALAEIQTVTTLPEYFDGPNTAGELHIHRTGKWLYASNVGHNSVVLFTTDFEKGTLTFVEEQGTGGKKPLHFGIEPSSKHLAISNMDSDTVLASRIDEGNGRLKPSGIFAAVPSPASIRFLPPAGPDADLRSAVGPARVSSPEVAADRRVTFRLMAPQAHDVVLTGEFIDGARKLEKDAQGLWSVTIGPIEPETYHYNFTIDGVRTIDPGNPDLKTGSTASTLASVLEVRGNRPFFYDGQAVPHGDIRTHWYHSKSLKALRRLTVYTPPGYDATVATRYPVLYLFHGANADENAWHRLGRVNLILDNLLAAGTITPFIVVMPFGYGVAPDAPAPPGRNTAAFGTDLIEDVIPFVEATYRVAATRDNRAIVGLSMGGGQALAIGLNHLDLFSHVGGFSSGLGPEADFAKTYGGAIARPGAASTALRLLWVGCGTDDGAFAASKHFSEFLTAHNVTHTFRATDGAHTWMVWRRYLQEIAPLLFR